MDAKNDMINEINTEKLTNLITENEEKIKEYKEEITKLNNNLISLEKIKRDISSEIYNKEKERINYYIQKEEEKQKKSNDIVEACKKINEDLIGLSKISEITGRDEYENKQLKEEITKRKEEINKNTNLLTEIGIDIYKESKEEQKLLMKQIFS